MKKCIFILLSFCFLVFPVGCSNASNKTVNKIIYDCDPYFFNDDSMTMSLLIEADNQGLIDLLGITITGGNKFIAESTNTALLNLEKLERTDIGVYQGIDIPLNGIPDFSHTQIDVKFGSLFNFDNYIEPSKYHDLGIYYEEKYGYSNTDVQEKSAVDYLVDTVKENPREITIIATGAMTNIASAIKKDSSFAKNVKQIIYMAGDFSKTGNVNQYSEYNAIYDPEAFDICLNADFPSQAIVPNEISKTLSIDYCVYDELLRKAESSGSLSSKLWIEYFKDKYSESILGENFAWDQACVAVLLYPECFTNTIDKAKVNVNIERNNEYGRTTYSSNDGDITIYKSLDNKTYWDYFTSLWANNYESDISYELVEKDFMINSSQLFPKTLDELLSYPDDMLKRIYSLSIIGNEIYCNDINDKSDFYIANVEPFPKSGKANHVIIRGAKENSGLLDKQINDRGPIKDLTFISKMTNLKELSIMFTDIESLEGIEKLKQLNRICINCFDPDNYLKIPDEFFNNDTEFIGDFMFNIEIENLSDIGKIKLNEYSGGFNLNGKCKGSMNIPEEIKCSKKDINGKKFDIRIIP